MDVIKRRLTLKQRLGATPRAPATPSPPDDDADLNRVYLTGTLGSEPLLYDVGDHPVARLALACQRRWRTTTGAMESESTWFNLTAWEELAEQCGRQLHRGDRVYVEGYLHLWSETRPPHSYACHTIVLDRIVLLAAARAADEGAQRTP
ncbi:MAG: single-stranded DNA-binding protein [Blastochloris sp.]|nr:single-stranded DNA-binding protein [Blastochloris sp.]